MAVAVVAAAVVGLWLCGCGGPLTLVAQEDQGLLPLLLPPAHVGACKPGRRLLNERAAVAWCVPVLVRVPNKNTSAHDSAPDASLTLSWTA